MTSGAREGIRLADLLGALGLAVDLGLGQPIGHVARSAALASRLAEETDLDRSRRADLVYVARLGWLGCIADSRNMAAVFGDDIDYRGQVYDLDMKPLPFLGYMLAHAGTTDRAPTRAAKRLGILIDGGRSTAESLRGHCQVTADAARRLDLGDSVCDALQQIFARWDGKGMPPDLSGPDIDEVIRIWHVADVAEVHHRRGGTSAAVEVLRTRSGGQFDPDLVTAFAAHADELLEPADDDWAFARAAAPDMFRVLTGDELDHALAVVGDWVDLKSAWFTGHSAGVADLADSAAARLGLDEDARTLVRHAAFVHDLGRTGVSNLIWDKADELTPAERERVRLHAYYTERMLVDTPALAEIGRIAAMAHERLDGSGYHRGLTAAAIPLEARVLAAADAYHTKLEPRPHRDAMTPSEAAEFLAAEVRAGRLDRDAADAVLAVAGQPRTGVGRPAGLTDREVEVLVLLAGGHTNKQIARRLSISPKTVGNHIEHIYAKAQVNTRAAATLFAMEHRLLDPLQPG